VICKKCNLDKPENQFSLYKSGNGKWADKLYRRKQCKSCLNEAGKAWCRNHKEHVKARAKKYREDPELRDKRLAQKRRDWEEHKTERSATYKRWRMKNKEKCAATRKRWYEEHKKEALLYHKQYREEHKDEIREAKRIDLQNYRKRSPKKRLNDCFRTYIYQSIRSKKAGRHWETLVGYSISDLMIYLQSQFKDGMSWSNYGQWHIDHIRPIASFYFAEPEDEEFKQCWALSNLQPLWAEENIKKSNKWESRVA
jgi:hypothetical protein